MASAQFPAVFIEVAAVLSAEAVVGVRADCVLSPAPSILAALVLDHYSRSIVVMVTQQEPLASR